MKNKIIMLLFGLILGVSIQIQAQKGQGFTLTCQLKGLPDGTKVYLTTQEKDTVTKAISTGDHFVFSGMLPLNGRFHFIKIDTLVSKTSINPIFLINGEMMLIGALGQKDIIVTGSPAHIDYVNLLNFLSPFQKEKTDINLVLKQCYMDIKTANKQGDTTNVRRLTAKVEVLYKNRDQISINRSNAKQRWLRENKQSLYAPYVIKGSLGSLGLEGMQESYNELPLENKQGYYGQELKKYLDSRKITVKIRKDNIIPNFGIKSSDGKRVTIHELAKKNKFTLIDFWASWCSPCRAAIPDLKNLYETYKDRGFGLVGISTDKSTTAWGKALVEDDATWFQGIDEDNISSLLFDMKAIPAYILIDNNGKLLAFDCAFSSITSFGGSLHGEALEEKIEELLGKQGK